MYQVEIPTQDEYHKVKKLLWRAFHLPNKFDEKGEDSTDWVKEGFSRSFVIREEDRIVANMTLEKYDTFIRGTKLPFNGIGAVATEPTHRRKGMINALFKNAFQSMLDAGEVFSMLDPFNIDFYEKFGYATSETIYSHELSPSNIRALGDSLNVREAVKDDVSLLFNLQKGTLSLGSRVFLSISEIERRIKGHNCYVVEDNGTAVGWFKLYFENERKGDRNRLKMILSLAMFYSSVKVLHNILSFVKKFDSQVEIFTINAVPEIPIRDLVIDRLKIKSEIQGSMMIRIVDFKKYCQLIKIPKNATNPVVIRLEDNHCSWNTGTYMLTPLNGRIQIESTEDEVDVAIDALTLSRIVGGLTPAILLYDTNLLTCDIKVAEDLEAIFSKDLLVSFIRF